mgnify:CR=1 FL=1
MIADGRTERIGNHLVSVNKMYHPEIGGVEVVAQRIAELGLHLFDKSTVITFNKENSMVEEEINEVHVIRLNTAYRNDPIRLSSNFGRVIRSFSSADTVFVFHFPSVQSELFFAHSNVKGKKVCFYHSDIVGRGSAGSLYNKLVVPKFLAKMDRIIVTSPNMKQSSACLKPFLDKVDVVPLFADIKHFHYQEDNKRREILERIGAGDEAKIILYIGRFGRYKGLDYLIKALALLPENYLLVLVGDGPERPIVETLTHELNLERRVLRFDHVPYSDLPRYYSAADVFVLPSIDRGEAFGLVVVEAMACGVPVVTTELGTGTSFHNIDGVTGMVVQPRNEKALADAISEICETRDKFDAETIRKRAEEFSVERFTENMQSLFFEVLKEK